MIRTNHIYPLMILLLAGALSPTSATAESAKTLGDVEAQIRSTAEQLEALDAEIARSNEEKISLVKSIEQAQSRVGEREQRLEGLDKDIGSYNERLDSLDTQLHGAQSAIEARKTLLTLMLRNSQSIGGETALKIVLQNDDPAMADRINVYTDYVIAAQNAVIAEQAAVLKRVSAARATVLKDRNWLNYIKKKASKQRDSYIKTAKATQRNLGQVESGISEKTQTVAQLRADQERLQALINELKVLQSTPSGYFIAGQGQYPAPVMGRVVARFGDVKAVGKLTWSGMFIEADRGEPVQAIADGEVIYSSWLQGFGNLVILDHGDNYTSLYGGNREDTVQTGLWVESGATIATVGDSGGQSTDGLYFQIRHNAKAIDPEKWLSKNNKLQLTSN